MDKNCLIFYYDTTHQPIGRAGLLVISNRGTAFFQDYPSSRSQGKIREKCWKTRPEGQTILFGHFRARLHCLWSCAEKVSENLSAHFARCTVTRIVEPFRSIGCVTKDHNINVVDFFNGNTQTFTVEFSDAQSGFFRRPWCIFPTNT